MSSITVEILEPTYEFHISEQQNFVAFPGNFIGTHEHDQRYYTKEQTDTLLSNKQDINSYIDGGAF